MDLLTISVMGIYKSGHTVDLYTSTENFKMKGGSGKVEEGTEGVTTNCPYCWAQS